MTLSLPQYLKDLRVDDLNLIDHLGALPADRILSGSDLKNIYALLHPVNTGHKLIRIGESGDGGYLVPNCLDDIDMCVSPGTAEQFQFELDLSRIFNIPSIMCDPSVDRPAGLQRKQSFDRIAIGCGEDEGVCRLKDWVSKYMPLKENSLILSMDIEGGEWNVFLNEDVSFLRVFKIMTLELHYLSLLHDREFVDSIFMPVIKKLTSIFDILHVHPNGGTNYLCGKDVYLSDCLEMTLLSKDSRRMKPSPAIVPHPLDHSFKNSIGRHMFL